MEETKRYGASGIRFSVKLRLGQQSEQESLEVLRILNNYPLEHITLHARLGVQQYKGEVQIDAFRQLASQCKHPLIYNGDVLCVEDIHRIEREFPSLEGIMIGRGLLERPTLAADYKKGIVSSDADVRAAVLAIHSRVLDEYMHTLEGGEAQVLSKIQPFWEYPGWCLDKKTVKKLSKTGSRNNYIKVLQGW